MGGKKIIASLVLIYAAGFVSVSDLDRLLDQAIAKGWMPITEAEAPPNALGKPAVAGIRPPSDRLAMPD